MESPLLGDGAEFRITSVEVESDAILDFFLPDEQVDVIAEIIGFNGNDGIVCLINACHLQCWQ